MPRRPKKAKKQDITRLSNRTLTKAQKRAKKPPPPFVGVALHPTTLKPLRSYKTGIRAFYGSLNTATGKITAMRTPQPQKFTKGEFRKLNRELRRVGSNTLVTYEERSNIRLRDKEGRRQVNHAGEKMYELKQRFGQPVKDRWRPVLNVKGERAREIDPRLTERTKREMIDSKILNEVIQDKTDDFIYHATPEVLRGETLKEAFDKIQLPVSQDVLDKKDVNKMEVTGTIAIPGEAPAKFRVLIDKEADKENFSNVGNSVAAAARDALAARGKRYTSMKKLRGFKGDFKRKAKKYRSAYNKADKKRDRTHARWGKATGARKAELKRELSKLDEERNFFDKKQGDVAEAQARLSVGEMSAYKSAKGVELSDMTFTMYPRKK